MPNNQRADYVAPHQHAAKDINGLAVAMFPPTESAVGTAANPTKSGQVGSVLPQMQIDSTVPSTFPLWVATLTFTGSFSSDAAGTGVLLTIEQDGTAIDTERIGTSPVDDYVFEMALQVTSDPIAAGTDVTFTVEWAATDLANVVTAVETYRRLELIWSPFAGVVP